jgi:hypothetical protein
MRPSDTAVLESKVRQLEKNVNELKDLLNVHENWNSEIKKMYGKKVDVTTSTSTLHRGELVWSDRYCICIYHDLRKCRVILNKGGIISIELAK